MSVSENDLVARAQGRIGTVLRGKYRLDSVLGTGVMELLEGESADGSSPSPPGARCVPPFFFEAQGNRIFKKECL